MLSFVVNPDKQVKGYLESWFFENLNNELKCGPVWKWSVLGDGNLQGRTLQVVSTLTHLRPSKKITVSRPGCGKISERGHFYFLLGNSSKYWY